MDALKKKAYELIIFFGLVSLLGDICYEGARSVNGPYLKTFGVSALAVGLIAGAGEFIGYGVRLLSGYFADKTRAYWVFVFIGYGLLISVPLLSLAGIWQIAALWIVLERFGKALRSPARDTVVSLGTRQIGTGWAFGLNEALDQIGALAGPLILSVFFFLKGPGSRTIADYQKGYSLFWIPYILLMVCVYLAYRRVPHPERLEEAVVKPASSDTLTKTFWLYTLFSFLATMGFVSFILAAYHMKAHGLLSDAKIPFYYAIAMAVDGVAALFIGKYYDVLKNKTQNSLAGLDTLFLIPILSLMASVFLFSGQAAWLLGGVIAWGIVMGMHETVMKSAIADLVTLKKRGTGYGIFNTAYGVAMFVGAGVMGFLYDRSFHLLFGMILVVEMAAVVVFFMIRREVYRKVKGDGA